MDKSFGARDELQHDLAFAYHRIFADMDKTQKFMAVWTALLIAQLPVGTDSATRRLPRRNTGWRAGEHIQQIPEPQNELPPDDLRDATVRQISPMSEGGSAVRIHLTNAFGTEALQFTSVHIARPLSSSSAAIDPVSDRSLTFAGQPAVTVPPRRGVCFQIRWITPLAPLSDLAVTFHLDLPPAEKDRTSGIKGNLLLCARRRGQRRQRGDARHVDHWYQLSEIDVKADSNASGAASVVALGDSITDGHGATTNGNDR